MIIDTSPPSLAHREHALHLFEETLAHLALERDAPLQEKVVEEIAVVFLRASGPTLNKGDGRT